MSLQILVKAGTITNLSDARYCAGMGVEIIGFPVGKTTNVGLSSTKIKEITGWLSGIKIALEFDEPVFDEKYALEMIQELNPDYIQLPIALRQEFRKITSIPLLLLTNSLEKSENKDDIILLYSGNIIHNEKVLKELCSHTKVILSSTHIDITSIKSILADITPFGIELKGGTEISPGLKSFDELSEIFEILEIED
jgi:phosphoribosylanthranilate isomerase